MSGARQDGGRWRRIARVLNGPVRQAAMWILEGTGRVPPSLHQQAMSEPAVPVVEDARAGGFRRFSQWRDPGEWPALQAMHGWTARTVRRLSR